MQPSQPRPKKMLDQVRETIQVKHYSHRTKETYVQWIRRYILFHEKRHPKDLGLTEIKKTYSLRGDPAGIGGNPKPSAQCVAVSVQAGFVAGLKRGLHVWFN